MPAVVQSLLSMVTAATAPRIAAKLRTECNRIDSGTLCLTFEVSTKCQLSCDVWWNGNGVADTFANTKLLFLLCRSLDALLSQAPPH